MSKIYDISKKITNELPTVKITDDIICTVNNRKSTVLKVQAMLQEMEEKAAKKGVIASETEQMKQSLDILVGEKHSEAIEQLDLPINEYREVFKVILQLARGENPGISDIPN